MIKTCKKCGIQMNDEKDFVMELSAFWDEKKKEHLNGKNIEVCCDCWEKHKDNEFVNYCYVVRWTPCPEGYSSLPIDKIGDYQECIRSLETYRPQTVYKKPKCSKCNNQDAIAKGIRNFDDCSEDPKGKQLYKGYICGSCVEQVFLQAENQMSMNNKTANNTSTPSSQNSLLTNN